jgi:predicted RND superfamily exporter protein
MRNVLARIAGGAVERPTPVIVAAVLLTLMGAIAALGLQADRSPDSLVDRSSDTYAQTQRFYEEFGDEPVEVLVQGDLRQLLRTDNLTRLLALETCLAGNAPEGQVAGGQPPPSACTAISRLDPSAVVFGPATFLNQFAIQANKLVARQLRGAQDRAEEAALQAASQARQAGLSAAEQQQAAVAASQSVLLRLYAQFQKLASEYGQTGLPQLENPSFVRSVICDQRFSGCTPKARFSALVPSRDAALISVRLRPDLSESERREAISLFREAVADPSFRLEQGSSDTQPSYLVSGVPVVFEGLAEELSTQIFVLLAAALAAMVITLALVFRAPLRLLPLGIALGATGIVFGVLALVGGSLTMASIAVLPVLIGLSVDYAIQLQARFAEAVRAGSSPPRAAVEAAARGGPVIATAGLATVAGFAVLVLSPIPMVRGFALLLVLGLVVAFALALTVGLSALSLLRPSAGAPAHPASPAGRSAPAPRASGPAGQLRAVGGRALAFSIAAPGRVLAVAALVAILGWGVGTRIPVISDIRELVPGDLPALQNVDELEEATGISGLTYVTVTAPDLTEPAVIRWMHDFEQRVLARHGFEGRTPSCRDERTEICPEISLPDFLYAGGQDTPSRQRIRASLRLLPPYVAQALVTTDPDTGEPGDTG